MQLPSTTHVMECQGFGEPDVLRWVKRPLAPPSPNQVLIAVKAAGVNRADILQRRGKYPPPVGASDILGLEVAGTILALGSNVTRLKAGDNVCALLDGGGYAEHVAVDAGQCIVIPQGLSMTEAACLPECVITVWANLFELAALKTGEHVLVHGGSSGIGTTAIQMIKAFGAFAHVTVGSDEKAAACLKLGAATAINYKTTDFVDAIKHATEGRGVDIVLDMVGGDYVNRNLATLTQFGRHVNIATQQGRMANIDLREVMAKRLILAGSTLRNRPATEKARLCRIVEEKVWPWVDQKRLNPLIYMTAQIKYAAEAHKVMESGTHIGKIALEVSLDD